MRRLRAMRRRLRRRTSRGRRSAPDLDIFARGRRRSSAIKRVSAGFSFIFDSPSLPFAAAAFTPGPFLSGPIRRSIPVIFAGGLAEVSSSSGRRVLDGRPAASAAQRRRTAPRTDETGLEAHLDGLLALFFYGERKTSNRKITPTTMPAVPAATSSSLPPPPPPGFCCFPQQRRWRRRRRSHAPGHVSNTVKILGSFGFDSEVF